MMNRGALTLLLHRDVTIGEGGHWMKRLDCKLLRTLHKAACPRCLSITGTLLQNDLTELPRVLEYVGPQLSIHDDADQQPPREAVAALSRRWGLRVSEQREKKSCDNIGNREVSKRPAAARGEERVLLLEYLQKGPQSFLLRRVKANVDIQLPPKYNGANTPPSHPAHTEAASVLRPGAIIRAPQQQPPHAPLRVLRASVFSSVTSTLIRMKGCCTSHQPSSACERLSCIRKVSGTLKLLDVMRLKLRRRGPLAPLFVRITRSIDLFKEYLSVQSAVLGKTLCGSGDTRTIMTIDGSRESDLTKAVMNLEKPQVMLSQMLLHTRLYGSSSAETQGEAIRHVQGPCSSFDEPHNGENSVRHRCL
ncbi:helicase-like protein [Leishmania braziliensis MHOM/BR/75/M2904]|uniref:Helicase-like protein n=1 Tax=Leishmania braziliensis TaxID=5660 RepID=A4HJL4_LEIBR|nr:helicase-like protein [Leishmania braziliensis MHOM/BR/75/M2904]CAJ2478052.1 unnamed protein product [Leishmania braziliensis]CAM42679.2 helicase-like protein [Leishmania braziliensis MHOM/BR/75/M2904]